MTTATEIDLVDALTPRVEQLFERHLTTTKPWLPHELVPWERAATFGSAGLLAVIALLVALGVA